MHFGLQIACRGMFCALSRPPRPAAPAARPRRSPGAAPTGALNPVFPGPVVGVEGLPARLSLPPADECQPGEGREEQGECGGEADGGKVIVLYEIAMPWHPFDVG